MESLPNLQVETSLATKSHPSQALVEHPDFLGDFCSAQDKAWNILIATPLLEDYHQKTIHQSIAYFHASLLSKNTTAKVGGSSVFLFLHPFFFNSLGVPSSED